MKIVVLGSTGFIGGNIVSRLKGTKHKVYPYSSKTANLLNLSELTAAFKRDKPDAIINCAAHTGSGQYVNAHAAEVFSDNALMALNLYRAVQQVSPKARVLNLISNCSYPGDIGLQKEEDWLKGPVHDSIFAYGNAKRTLYYTAIAFAKEYQIESINLIIPEVFGPGDNIDPAHTHATDGMIIRMLKAREEGAKEFVMWGTGKPVRETIFVKDVTTIVARALVTDTALIYPINVGQGKGRSILQTARMIQRVSGFRGHLTCDTMRQDGAPMKVLSGVRFKKVFPGFSFTAFESGIRETVRYYEKALLA